MLNGVTEEICAYLRHNHVGKKRAVHCSELGRLMKISGRSIRRRIAALRRNGYPICSDECGYFYADTDDEVDRTAKRLKTLETTIATAREGLLTSSRKNM